MKPLFDQPQAVDLLVAHFGSQITVARSLGVTSQAVSKWRRQRVPLRRAAQLEKLSGGKLTISMIRPDLFVSDNVKCAECGRALAETLEAG